MADTNQHQDGGIEDVPVEIDPMLFRKVMGHYPTGVTVVAALDGDRPVGLAIGSFFSVSLEPPLVGFCVARTSGSWPRIESAGVFGISVLAEDQHETSGRFASRVEDKFEGERWEPSEVTGSPVIAGALAHIDCSLHSVLDGGDHVIVLGLVRSLEVQRDDVGPLLFFRGGYGAHRAL
jgi:3-hydroxy-9,10-secoandrosta-1,3,5(10)-triene-9,17-dione monooxygenase reductase component